MDRRLEGFETARKFAHGNLQGYNCARMRRASCALYERKAMQSRNLNEVQVSDNTQFLLCVGSCCTKYSSLGCF